MRLVRLTVENCKSYRDREEIELDEASTILVGPNGGGKSNTLDIITVVLRRFFLPSYTIQENRDAGVLYTDIRRQNLFQDTTRFLDKHIDAENLDQALEIVLRVGSADLHNIRTILERRDDFEQSVAQYRNTPFPGLGLLDNWDVTTLQEGEEITFGVENGNMSTPVEPGPRLIHRYLDSLHFFILLAKDLDNVDLRPALLYFSPYRGAQPQDLQANLSGDRFVNLLHQYFNSTSRSQTSLIKLASVYFAEKKRRMEVGATEQGWETAWKEDEEVRLVTDYMHRLGYEWQLTLVDANKNIYEITLQRDGREFAISKASSGEKEILNFVFGIFALRIRDGLLLVDEPELHLHPRWQGLLRDLFAELSESTGNQFFLSTHSPVFITPQTVRNVRRVAKPDGLSTRVIAMERDGDGSAKDLLHIINSHNNERIFFADKVLLVEGIHDRLIFQRLIDLYRSAADVTEVIEVVEVYGKGNFAKYSSLLSSLSVPFCIVSDLDYALNRRGADLSDLFEVGWKKVDDNVLKNKKSKDRETLAELLEESIDSGNTETLSDFWNYVKGRHTKLRDDLGEDEEGRLHNALSELKTEGIHVLSEGEIERYLPRGYRKLEGTVELVRTEALTDWLKTVDTNALLAELESVCLWVLRLEDADIEDLRDKVIAELEKEFDEEEQEVPAEDLEAGTE